MGTAEDLIDEHFVPIEGYPNYEISNYGRVINVVSDKEITIVHTPDGVAYVRLYNRGRKTLQLRRLVAQAFFSDYKSWSTVYLISDNQDDCSVRNITLKAPERDTRKPFGTEKAVLIVELNEKFTTLTAAANRIGGSASVISKILYGHGKTHKGYTFQAVE